MYRITARQLRDMLDKLPPMHEIRGDIVRIDVPRGPRLVAGDQMPTHDETYPYAEFIKSNAGWVLFNLPLM